MSTKKEETHPLLVTGIFRSGKSTITKALLQTKKFRRIHEPFSNYRGPHHRSSIIKNLKHTFTYINKYNSIQYKSDIQDLLNHLTYSYRVSIDGGATAKKLINFLGKITLRYSHQWRQPLIDDPFLVLSVPWLHDALRWNMVILTRNPIDFVAVRKHQGFGFDVSHFARQKELLEGPLLTCASEVLDIAEKAGSLSLPIQNAYLWKYIHMCILQYVEKRSEIAFLRLEDMKKGDGFKLIAKWICAKYGIDLEGYSNPFIFEISGSDVLTDKEKMDVAQITDPISRHIYPNL
jgi:hypothetical protein